MQKNTVSASFNHVSYNDIKKPNECPRCHKGITPNDTSLSRNIKNSSQKFGGLILQYIFECPNCENLFIANYKSDPSNGHPILFSTEPRAILPPPIDEVIKSISPTFCEIYNQAIEADQIKLDQISGMGLRKALEFLIKDYCKKIYESNHDEIEKIQLGPCIEKYINSTKIKDIAKRAAWIGNDETHYVRKWQEHDINSLKTLLRITQHFIIEEVEAQRLINEMPEPIKNK